MTFIVSPIGLDSTIIYYYQFKCFDTKLNILNKKIPRGIKVLGFGSHFDIVITLLQDDKKSI